MVTVVKEKDDNEQEGQNGSLGGSIGTQGVGTGIPTQTSQNQTSAASQPSQQPRTAGTGRFQNLKSYISANQGAGQEMGSKIGGDIERESQGVGGQINEEKQRMETARQQESQRLQSAQPFIQQSVASARDTVGSPQDLERFTRLRTGQVDVPDFVEAPIEQGVGQLQNIHERTGSEQGRFDLLRGSFGAPDYSRGATRLDQLLLQSDPNALRNLNITGREEAKTQQSALDAALGLESQYGEEITGLGQDVAQQAIGEATGGQEALTNLLTQRSTDRFSSLQGSRESIAAKLAKGESLSVDDMDSLGLPEYERQRINELIGLRTDEEILDKLMIKDATGNLSEITGGGLGDSRYLDPTLGKAVDGGTIQEMHYRNAPKFNFLPYLSGVDESQFSAAGVATQDEIARGNALQQLLGEANIYDQSSAGQTPDTIGFRGTEAIEKSLAELAPQATYDSATGQVYGEGGEIEDEGILGIVNSVGDMFGSGVGGGVRKITAPVSRVASYVPIVGSFFCFATNSLIDMVDGTRKKVQDLIEGDLTLLGGKVLGLGWIKTPEVVEYKGMTVSPDHLFFINNIWKRARDVGKVKQVENGILVHPVITENHLLVSEGFISADAVEIDDFMEYNAEEVIELLNTDVEKLDRLAQEDIKLKGKKLNAA